MLVFSGEPGRTVPDGNGIHSPFTTALLKQLETPGQPAMMVFAGVAKVIEGSQKPWVRFDGSSASLLSFNEYPLIPSGSGGARTTTSTRVEEPAIMKPGDPPATLPQPERLTALDQGEPGRQQMIDLGQGATIALRYIPAGEFVMGSPPGEAERNPDEDQVEVTLTRHFWMAETELTQEQWQAVIAFNPSYFNGSNLPVENVGWDDIQNFLERLNAKNILPEGWEWALPTEAQWEYGCRAGTTTPFHFGSTLNGTEANCNGQQPYGTRSRGPSLEKTAPVGSYAANAWGLRDMSGNVWEWCQDWYAETLEGGTNPAGPRQGKYRVHRGGGYIHGGAGSRSADRGRNPPGFRNRAIGFRLVAVQE